MVFDKVYNAQHCLMVLIENQKAIIDNGGAFDPLMTNLLKAFHCLFHELLMAKLETYVCSKIALRLMFNKSMIQSAYIVKFCCLFLRAQYLIRYFPMFTYTLYCISQKITKLRTMQMTLPRLVQIKIMIWMFGNQNSYQQFFLNGSRTTI